jgi:hypothetical protein
MLATVSLLSCIWFLLSPGKMLEYAVRFYENYNEF